MRIGWVSVEMQGGTGIKIKKVKILRCMNLGNVYQIGKSRAIKKRTSLFLFTLEGSGITLDS